MKPVEKIRLVSKYEILLTDKDIDCVELAAEGLTRKEIGAKMRLARKTVEGRFYSLYKLFNARNTAHLVYLFRKENLIT